MRVSSINYSYMKSLMNLQTSCPRVAFIASGMSACKGLLTSMCQFMSLKMALCYELLSTLFAKKWTFTGMSPHVCFQISCFGKLFQAFFEWTHQYFLFFFGSLHLFNLSYIHYLLQHIC